MSGTRDYASIRKSMLTVEKRKEQLMKEMDYRLLPTVISTLDKKIAEYIELWKNDIREETNLIVVSIGSGGDAGNQQQAPNFATQSNLSFNVLNIDNYFSRDEFNSLQNKNIFYLPTSITPKLWNGKESKAYAILLDAMQEQIERGKIVCLMYHTDPLGYRMFADFIQKNEADLNKNLFIVGSYHANQPVCLFDEGLVNLIQLETKIDKEKVGKDNLEALHNGLEVLYKHPDKELSSDDLHHIVKDYGLDSLGKFFTTLKELTVNQFNLASDQKQTLTNNQQSEQTSPRKI